MENAENRFTGYELVGRGTFGEVFVAHDSVLNRRVAIKRYYKAIQQLDNVLQSVSHWSKLNHPNIAQVLDYSDQDGIFSVTMTFCGRGEILQKLPILMRDQVRLASYFSQIGNAVGYIHSQNLVHRDLKLSNIMMDDSDNCVLIDLDLCVDVRSTLGRNQVGTLAYMAPELLRDDGCHSFHSDQFALGVILFELVSGKQVENTPRISEERKAGHSCLPELNPSIAKFKDWNAIIAKATQSIPEKRYATIGELVADVERLIDGKSISARSISRSERAIRWVRNNPLTSSLLSVSIVIVLIGASVGLFLWTQASLARIKVQNSTRELSQRLEEAEARKTELATLVSTVSLELTQVEKSELEQRQATDAAQATRSKLQQEAERSKKLTSELNDLLAKAVASAEAVKAADQSREQAAKKLEEEQQKIADKEYATKVREIWASVTDQLWEKSQLALQSLPNRSRGIEYEVLQRAIKNRMPKPVRIELGRTPTKFDQESLLGLKLGNPQKCQVVGDTRLQVEFRSERASLIDFKCKVSLTLPENGTFFFEAMPQQESEKVIALLKDGSLLVSSGSKLAVWTFSPQDYSSSDSRMLPEMEDKLKQSIVKLEPVTRETAKPKAAVPTNVEATLAHQEVEPWKYFKSVSSVIGLSNGQTNIVRLEYTNRAPISVTQFSKVADLTMLKYGDFAFSQVDDDCLASIAKCSQLEHLNFWSASRVTDVGIGHLKNLPKLTFLNIGFTQASLEGIDSTLLGHLEILCMNGTTLGPSRLAKLAGSKNLREIHLIGVNIEDSDLAVLNNPSSLRALYISGRNVSLEGIDELVLKNLETLELTDISLGPSRLSKLANCKKLQTLKISSKDFTDQDLAVLKELSALTFLTVAGREVSLESIDESLLKNLKHLTLDGVSFGPSRLSKLVACKNLTDLSLRSMDLNDQDLEVLGRTPKVKVLRVSNAPITDKGLDFLEGKKDFSVIVLDRTSVSLVRAEDLRRKLPKCTVTYLSSTSEFLPPIGQKGAWFFYAMETSTGKMTQKPGEMILEMTKLGTALWNLQVYSRPISLTEGGKYRVALYARSASNSTVELEAGQSSGKYSNVGLRERITLTPEFKRYEFSFTVKGQGQEKTRVGLLLGLGLGTVEVRAFELTPL